MKITVTLSQEAFIVRRNSVTILLTRASEKKILC
jgi:hypothetical protein